MNKDLNKEAMRSMKKKTKKQRKAIEWERLEISSRKLELPREHLCKVRHNKGWK